MYEPQEDSIMLSEVVKKFLSNNKCDCCLDMGTGTGIQGLMMSSFCTKIICADINTEAVNYVSNIVKKNDNVLVIESDLFSNLQDYKGKFDLIVFNPPYLPREKDEIDDIELTSEESGIGITSKFVKDSKFFLSSRGKLFFVVSSLSDTDSLNSLLDAEGFIFKIVKEEHFFFEDIMIYEAELK